MYEPLRRLALAFLKVPPEPHPPLGDPASLRVFRAGRNYYRLRLAVWAAAQLLALGAFLFWTAILVAVEHAAAEQRTIHDLRPATNEVSNRAGSSASPADASSGARPRSKNRVERFVERVESAARKVERTQAAAGKTRSLSGWVAGYRQFLVEFALLLPAGIFPLIWAVKVASFVIYLVQIPVTYAVRRLDYEMRWYMVTDRSLRLRHGVWKISESTMSFANIQQVEVIQGPVQRLLGLADVKVQSAGGGGEGIKHRQTGEDMHLGLFHGVGNAAEIRGLILDRLRQFRDTGLGNPDEPSRPANRAAGSATAAALTAARELVAEARALRVALGNNDIGIAAGTPPKAIAERTHR